MAVASVVNTVLKRNEAKDLPMLTAIDAADGLNIPCAADQKMLIILEKTGAAGDLVLKAGSAVQGTEDLAVTFSAAGTKVLNIESGKYAKDGYLHFTGTGKAGCVVLP